MPSDTVAIELWKNGEKIADLNDNTYGTFFNGFANGTAEQQLYVGFLLEFASDLSTKYASLPPINNNQSSCEPTISQWSPPTRINRVFFSM